MSEHSEKFGLPHRKERLGQGVGGLSESPFVLQSSHRINFGDTHAADAAIGKFCPTRTVQRSQDDRKESNRSQNWRNFEGTTAIAFRNQGCITKSDGKTSRFEAGWIDVTVIYFFYNFQNDFVMIEVDWFDNVLVHLVPTWSVSSAVQQKPVPGIDFTYSIIYNRF